MLNGRNYVVIACVIAGCLTLVVMTSLLTGGDSDETAQSFKDVATALIQVTGGAVGGTAIGYQERKRQEGERAKEDPEQPPLVDIQPGGDTLSGMDEWDA